MYPVLHDLPGPVTRRGPCTEAPRCSPIIKRAPWSGAEVRWLGDPLGVTSSSTPSRRLRSVAAAGVGILACLTLLSCEQGAPEAGPSGPEPMVLPAAEPPEGLETHGFTQIRSLRELPDGRVLVADAFRPRLLLVTWETQTAEVVGREGQGPLEYESPDRLLGLGGDSTLLTERTRPRAILEGGEITRPVSPAHPFVPLLGGEGIVGADSTGRILAVRGHRAASSLPGGLGHGPDSMVAVLSDRAWARLDTVAWLGGGGFRRYCIMGVAPDGRTDRTGGCSPVYFEEQAVLFPDGWTAVVRADPYRVDWLTADGRRIHGDPLPFTPQPLDDAERCAAARGWPFRGLEEDCEPADIAYQDWPDHLAPFIPVTRRGRSGRQTPASFAAPDGNLLIRRLPTRETMTRETRYDIIDRQGKLAGVISLPAEEAIVGTGARYVYVIRTDEFDVQWLRRHPWQ